MGYTICQLVKVGLLLRFRAMDALVLITACGSRMQTWTLTCKTKQFCGELFISQDLAQSIARTTLYHDHADLDWLPSLVPSSSALSTFNSVSGTTNSVLPQSRQTSSFG